jgi:hypothetical protein
MSDKWKVRGWIYKGQRWIWESLQGLICSKWMSKHSRKWWKHTLTGIGALISTLNCCGGPHFRTGDGAVLAALPHICRKGDSSVDSEGLLDSAYSLPRGLAQKATVVQRISVLWTGSRTNSWLQRRAINENATVHLRVDQTLVNLKHHRPVSASTAPQNF